MIALELKGHCKVASWPEQCVDVCNSSIRHQSSEAMMSGRLLNMTSQILIAFMTDFGSKVQPVVSSTAEFELGLMPIIPGCGR